MEDALLTTQEAAAFLGVSKAFLERDRWAETEIPYVKIGSRTVRYRLSDLQQYVDERVSDSDDDVDPDDEDWE